MHYGRVVFYNSQRGKGKLVLKSKERFDFSIDICDGFESIPAATTEIECMIENGVVKSVKPLQKITQKEEGLVPTDDQEGTDQRVSKALEKYFNSINSLIGEQNGHINTKSQLDYFLSKRFLMTAYNNLKNFDPSIHDHRDITEKLKLIHQLHKAYYNAGDKAEVPQLAFETIFLNSQPEYHQFISDQERCVRRISVLTSMEQSLSPEIKGREAEIKKLKKNDKKRSKLEDELKPLRGNYVDAVDEKASTVEELAAMEDIKVTYTEKYYDSFINELSKLSEEFKNVLATILNFKAYELDELIWMNAARSKLIQEYFQEAGIDGDYSTLTYLRYYLNTLDKKKIGDEHDELFKFLEYLEKEQK